MKYRHLGNSGLLVSRICLGTMTFGMKGWGCDQATSKEITNRFIDAGGNFIDTADIYSAGVSEEFVGSAIADHERDDLVIATKCWFRLGTDYLDLYQLHGPDPYTPMEETMGAMDQLVSSGKVRYIGCSNYYGWQIVKANAIAQQHGWSKLISGQHLYNLLRRDVEREILPACQDQGLGLMCWGPLASGLLTGKYDASKGPEKNSRIGLRADIDVPRYWSENSFKIIDAVKAVARETEKSPAQVAFSWLLFDRRVASVIMGSRTVEQAVEGIVSGEWDLSAEHHLHLSNVVPFNHGYPHDWIQTSKANAEGHEI